MQTPSLKENKHLVSGRHGMGAAPLVLVSAGLDNAKAIAATSRFDVVWSEHFDRTNFRGIPDQYQHPDYLDAIHHVAATVRDNDEGAGFRALHGLRRQCRNELTVRFCCGMRLG